MSVDFQKAKSIFLDALEKSDSEDRQAVLDERCDGDTELRQHVELLLDAHQQPGSFVEKGALAANPTFIPPITEQPGDTIGPYKLLQQIGEGGMGTVFMAEQTEPIERRVALKIIKRGMDTQQVIARFEAERQALAMMDHPNIAKVLDAGTTETGRPYFVMELVKGIPITNYCDQQHLSVKERLELFLPVCQAIQHAHQKGIIHRDVKPSNVLVARYDGKPIPKVIDFGVAKATSQRLTEKTMFTKFGQIVGTVEYMSPEQAEFNQLDIDTRSDIYSLGVLLYELLTGETPFDKKRLRSAAFDELLRILREEEPPRPSTKVSGSQSQAVIASNRKTEPGKLSLLVRNELDWIVMKAMEKERNRRYETANSLADDLQRYLNDDPVQACPPSAGYKFRKFVRRNKTAVVSGSLAAAALMVVAVSLIIGYRGRAAALQSQLDYQVAEAGRIEERILRNQAEDAQQAAEAAEENARLDTQVAEGLLLSTGSSPELKEAIKSFSEVIEKRPAMPQLYLYRGGAFYRSDQLQKAKEDLDRALQLQPEDNLAAHQLLAIITQRLGLEEVSQHHLQEVQRANPDSVEALTVQALALNDRQGIELLSRAIEADPFNPVLLRYRGYMHQSVMGLEGASAEQLRLAVTDLEKSLKAFPEDQALLSALFWLYDVHGKSIQDMNPTDRCRELLDRLVEVAPNSLTTKNRQVEWHQMQGDHDAAIGICQELQERFPDDCHQIVLLALAYQRAERFEEAIEVLDRAIPLSPDDPTALRRKAHCQIQVGDLEGAKTSMHRLLDVGDRAEWPAVYWFYTIKQFRDLGELQMVEKLLKERIEIHRRILGTGNQRTLKDIFELAEFLKDQKHPSQAEDLYYEAIQVSRRMNGDDHRFTVKCIEKLIHLVGRRKMLPGAKAQPFHVSRVYSLRACSRAVNEQYPEAAADLDRGVNMIPSSPNEIVPPRRDYYRIAMQFDDEVYEELLKLRPDDLELQYERAIYLALQGDFESALDAFPDGEISESLFRVQMYCGILALLNQQEDRYQKVCQTLTAQENDLGNWSRDQLNNLGFLASAGENAGLDKQFLIKLADQLQQHETWYCTLAGGACSLRADQYKQALTQFNRVKELLGEDSIAGLVNFWLAIAHHHMGNHDESRQWYDRGVKDLCSVIPTETGLVTAAWPGFWLKSSLAYREATALLGLEPDETITNFGQPQKTVEVAEPLDANKPNEN